MCTNIINRLNNLGNLIRPMFDSNEINNIIVLSATLPAYLPCAITRQRILEDGSELTST